MTFWCEETDAVLRERYNTLDSMALIAQTMNARFGSSLSRNAIIGRAHRLDLPRRGAGWQGNEARERKSSSPRKPAMRKPSRFNPTVNFRPILGRVTPAPTPIIDPLNLTFDQIGANQCRFITTSAAPWLFCGHPTVQDTSWCAHCLSVVFEPRKQKVAA